MDECPFSYRLFQPAAQGRSYANKGAVKDLRIFKLHGYDIIHELRRHGIEAISDTVTIPGLSALAVAEPAERYQTEKTIALDKLYRIIIYHITRGTRV